VQPNQSLEGAKDIAHPQLKFFAPPRLCVEIISRRFWRSPLPPVIAGRKAGLAAWCGTEMRLHHF
jgi:hypothetical protein